MSRAAERARCCHLLPGHAVFALLLGSFYLADSNSAAALPAFAAQTGLPCAACHDGFPELTPLGRRFKLDGYITGGSYPMLDNIAAMVQAGFTQLHAKVPGGLAPDYSGNNAWSIQQTSLFYGGAIDADIGLGAFVQGTFDGVAHQFAWDNTDIRLAQHAKLMAMKLTYGFTFNNAPSVTSNSHFEFPRWGDLCGRLSRGDWRWLSEGEGEQQVFPRWKDEERGDARELAEEVITRPELGARLAPEFVGNFANRVDGEGQ